MHILLSNDDGIDAEGLQLLRSVLMESNPGWRVTTVAPERDQSATSHSLTLTVPLRIERRGEDQFSVSGTPTDCVLVAMQGLLREDPPDLVISGINHGPNMGEDVHYSGTVAAAFEGMILGLPALAVSLASKQLPRNFAAAEHFVAEVLPRWLPTMQKLRGLWNVNLPAAAPQEVRGIRVCPLGSRTYGDQIIEKKDPRGRAYYWIGGDDATYADQEGTDFVLSAEGFVTVTPLQVDLTDTVALEYMRPLTSTWMA